eukprot:CAMPEP_0185036078 /NCGR_PEP_ID=MMETSP1103-20130426/28517_1 /TAXON_ID=36769 /ORGANISM="Paraphysomonas bandaiensis, Strain Caron Lab Isolate" /LENGTH=1549 /DNA_ID=CAMNT_0027573461 /DNA_START=157 /DNA_END=4806 /DNA_ORIENTATION=-
MPYMLSYGIVSKGTSPSDLTDSDFKDLANKFKIKLVDSKYNRPLSVDQIIRQLWNHTEHLDVRRGGRRVGNASIVVPTTHAAADRGGMNMSATKTKFKELDKNYFGLPPYALNRTAEGIVYQCRKPYEHRDLSRDADATSFRRELEHALDSERQQGDTAEHKKAENHIAQRKVAAALSAMARNEAMRSVFVYKGGVDAVIKLAYESTDTEVLSSCASSIGKVAEYLDYTTHLIEKNVIPLTSCLIENGDEQTRFCTAIAICNMTTHDGLDTTLVRAGVMMPLQSLLSSSRLDTLCFTLLSIHNVANCMTAADAEGAVRLCLQGCKRLDFMHDYESADFIGRLFRNMSRMPQYVSLLGEEGVLPVLISLLECQPVTEIVDSTSETFFNLSMLRKNRRDIYGSGVAQQIIRMVELGSPQSRAYTLLMVGNLLGSGLIQDKIAKEDVLNTVIDLLDPKFKEQCLAAAFVISHLSHSLSAGSVMVNKCDVVPKVLKLVAERKQNGIEVHAVSYLWTALANLAHKDTLFDKVMEEKTLATTLAEEATNGDQQEIVAQLMLNMSEHAELYTIVGDKVFAKLVLSFKTLFIRGDTSDIRKTSICILINLAICIPESRAITLGNDLVDILEESGLDSPELNHKFITLLYLISCEPTLCPKLVDFGVQRMLMTVVKTVTDEGRDVIAAILHNLSLKRALLGTGVLGSLVSFLRNCKSIRVLWVSRAIANMSSYPRSRAILSKEKKLVPCLSGIMRTGSQEADRVQHYCALAICNIFGSHLDKSIVDNLIKNGTVVDLVVVTLLRVNSITTKEALGKALFNLLSRGDVREELVKLDVLEALIELSRIELSELLELSVKSVFNISCETKRYAKKLEALKVPHAMISRMVINPELQGARATTTVKITCGKAIANMSFDNELATAMTHEKLAEACNAINNLKSDEARYCAAVTVFNVSFLDNCMALANSVAVPMLVSILQSGPILCTQLAVAALCNFSLHEVFMDQLSSLALAPLIKAISAAHLDSTVKIDIVYFIYNVTTAFEPSHKVAIEGGVIVAMAKIVKVHTDEQIIGMVGRILKEVCMEDTLSRRLLADGVMPIILKLAKYEYPSLKLDLASAMCSMSVTPDTSLKMLKLEAIDILFWLTLHDCLNMYDPIRKYVARTVRNFTIQLEDALYMSKEERFISVIKVLCKSTNDDVLWQTAVVVYNMLNSPSVVRAPDGSILGGKKVEVLSRDCKDTLLKRGVIQIIFDLAATGSDSVKHLCSASLHSVAEHIPNSDDPAVLQLIMALLDADGDQFGEVGDRVANDLPYSQVATPHGTDFSHTETGFTGNWQPLSCEVDSIFKPASIPMEVSGSAGYDTKPLTSGIVALEQPVRFKGEDFGSFRGESRPSTSQVETIHHDDDPLEESETDDPQGGDPHATLTSQEGGNQRVRFRDVQGVVTGFSDDESTNPNDAIRAPDISPRGPSASGTPKGGTGRKDLRRKSSSGIKSPGRHKKQVWEESGRSSTASVLPSILNLSADKPQVPSDTLGALQGTEYKPKSPKHMVSVQRSFSGARIMS